MATSRFTSTPSWVTPGPSPLPSFKTAHISTPPGGLRGSSRLRPDSGGNPVWVNGTRCDGHGFQYRDEVNCTVPPAGPLVNQPTNHPATLGHYDFKDLLGFDPPDGVSISINVKYFLHD
jgi:hypothetical protein